MLPRRSHEERVVTLTAPCVYLHRREWRKRLRCRGTLVSGGAVGDSACVVAVSTTQYIGVYRGWLMDNGCARTSPFSPLLACALPPRCCSRSSAAASAHFYVSQSTGNDADPGIQTQPFQSGT